MLGRSRKPGGSLHLGGPSVQFVRLDPGGKGAGGAAKTQLGLYSKMNFKWTYVKGLDEIMAACIVLKRGNF